MWTAGMYLWPPTKGTKDTLPLFGGAEMVKDRWSLLVVVGVNLHSQNPRRTFNPMRQEAQAESLRVTLDPHLRFIQL